MSKKVSVLEFVTRPPCHRCGSTLRIVDGDGKGKFWLLCGDTGQRGCVFCEPLPPGMEVEP